jgi:hypothetical protein
MKQFTKIVMVLVLTIAHIQTIVAQNFDDDVIDSPPASIDQCTHPLMVLIIAFVYMILKVKKPIKESNKS